ncbi:unnamed protein product [Cuscuta campestris]|uniref:F-box domain-containing protein n=1 Tax=Cuscuta campestris TaxID=132261 RepID=A0A484K2L4_9ASTE|nr:unnamed protein product [Cuscuta campestris]
MDCSNTHLMKGTTSGGSEDGESSNSCTRPNRFLELPEDVIRDILRRLGVEEILVNAQRVCSSWRKMCKDDPSMWRFIDMKRLGGEDECLEVMCAEAVDRSQGQLTEIHIDHFATDKLLDYISESTPLVR